MLFRGLGVAEFVDQRNAEIGDGGGGVCVCFVGRWKYQRGMEEDEGKGLRECQRWEL